jgi:hypothetical protein
MMKIMIMDALWDLCSTDVGSILVCVCVGGGGGGLFFLVRLDFYIYGFSVSLCSKYNLNRI